jgi:hypothetical protein
MPIVLFIGACGQIGTESTAALRQKHGAERGRCRPRDRGTYEAQATTLTVRIGYNLHALSFLTRHNRQPRYNSTCQPLRYITNPIAASLSPIVGPPASTTGTPATTGAGCLNMTWPQQ